MTERSFRKVLVANRGEIARRVFRTLREMGIASVAVYSDADADALHVRDADEAVRLGPAPSSASYLDAERVLEVAKSLSVDAIHPGYGFLAENADFAEACGRAGLTFIGPSPTVIRAMGDKIAAKTVARDAGVQGIPGFALAEVQPKELAARAAEVGYPLLVKAAAGGGGTGMRIVREPGSLEEAIAAARREAGSAFGSDALLIERYLEGARHIEVQIVGDSTGDVVHCFERECSLQRRYQKIVEEAPSPAVDAEFASLDLRKHITDAAVRLGRAMAYEGAGTVEFAVDRVGAFYFLEVNTRLQVEHPVTEGITGLDLVKLQIEIAQGRSLAVLLGAPAGAATQDAIGREGHAIEVRLYAEDADAGFLPSTGVIDLWETSAGEGVRIETGVETGSEVSVHYDPMLAKFIAHGPSREAARTRLIGALERLAVGGPTTNRDFLLRLLETRAFADGDFDTQSVETRLASSLEAAAPNFESLAVHAMAAVLRDWNERRARGSVLPSGIPSGWRNHATQPQRQLVNAGGEALYVDYRVAAKQHFDITVGTIGAAGDVEAVEGSLIWAQRVRLCAADATGVELEIDAVRRAYRVAAAGPRRHVHSALGNTTLEVVPRFPPAARVQIGGGCLAPMTGVIREVCVEIGDRVEEGATLVVLEAMKMEHPLIAQSAGVVSELRVEVGQMVDPDEILVVIDDDREPEEG